MINEQLSIQGVLDRAEEVFSALEAREGELVGERNALNSVLRRLRGTKTRLRAEMRSLRELSDQELLHEVGELLMGAASEFLGLAAFASGLVARITSERVWEVVGRAAETAETRPRRRRKRKPEKPKKPEKKLKRFGISPLADYILRAVFTGDQDISSNFEETLSRVYGYGWSARKIQVPAGPGRMRTLTFGEDLSSGEDSVVRKHLKSAFINLSHCFAGTVPEKGFDEPASRLRSLADAIGYARIQSLRNILEVWSVLKRDEAI